MPFEARPAGTFDAIFGVQTNWPRWRQIVFAATFSEEFTDSTHNGAGDINLMGGNYSRSVAGTRTFDRWASADGLLSGLPAGLLHASGASHGWQGGALYTHKGSAGHPDPITDVGGLYSITVQCEWDIYPLLDVPETPSPFDLPVLRSASDGRMMSLKAGGTGGIWGWEEGTFVSSNDEFTISTTATGIVPAIFELADIAAAPFSFSQTLSTISLYHPTAEDTPYPDPFYPMRGSTTYLATSSISVTFVE